MRKGRDPLNNKKKKRDPDPFMRKGSTVHVHRTRKKTLSHLGKKKITAMDAVSRKKKESYVLGGPG